MGGMGGMPAGAQVFVNGMGGMPGGMPGGMGGMATPRRDEVRVDAIAPGTACVLRDLQSQPQLNDERATVRGFDAAKGRYLVEIDEGAQTLSLKRANVQQLVPRARVRGVESKPELNGATGTVVAHDAAKGRYTVLVKPSGAARTQAVSLQPQNVVLPAGVCVRIEGLVKGEQYNDEHGTIASFDEESERYVVQLAAEKQLKLKSENVIA